MMERRTKAMFRRVCCVLLIGTISFATCDVYLHNPRGSNNRLDEKKFNRQNANRLFDSQNNNRGGYNVGSLYYYEGSILQIEWTNQHSCASSYSHCELIIQYMCADLVRDGATTDQIPSSHTQCRNFNCNTDKEYGMHESYDYFNNCQWRERNKGLFTADQNLKKKYATYTRQNPNGNRRGYECPEERDYFPYWHPTPWKDIVVMTNDPQRCRYYKNETENVKPRWACVLIKRVTDFIPNNKQDCEQQEGTWTEFSAHGIPAPNCQETEFTRDNHLGNGIGGNPNRYNWTVPNFIHDNCVLRIRYNISTSDYDPWHTFASNNQKNRGDGSDIDIYTKYGITPETGRARGYKFKNNPEVKVFGEADFELQLAINTNQYGRVFQDRSHTFAIRNRPDILKSHAVHNLNVRGKRGNIVQVYPGVEYDYVPNTLEMARGHFIHFQWTGSNTNPPEAEGNGLVQTDRSNVVLLTSQGYSESSVKQFGPGLVYGHYGNNYPDHLSRSNFLGMSSWEREALAFLGPVNRSIMFGHFGGEMSELDDVGTYFDIGSRNVTQVGTFHYMCTRNNDFSNRDQKGRIIVYPYAVSYHALGWAGGTAIVIGGTSSLVVDEGTFNKLCKLRLEEWSPEEGERQLKQKGKEIHIGEEYASNFFVVLPAERLTDNGKKFKVLMQLTKDNNDITVYRSNPASFASWQKVDTRVSGQTVSFQTDQGGVFIARTTNNTVGLIVGLILGFAVIVVLVVGTVCYFRRRPEKWMAVKAKLDRAHKSTQNQV